ncbi:MAG: sigma-E factor negative regulatory protein [Burkholderiaceae bacterium]
MTQEQDGVARNNRAAERCSALVDSELAEHEFRLAMAELRADPFAMQRWAIYHAVGDALRSPEVAACHSPRFAQAMHERLAAEPTVIAPVRRERQRRARVWLPALGLAASLAALAWAVLPMMTLPGVSEPALFASLPPSEMLILASGPETTLRGYLDAHLELASGTAFAAPLPAVPVGLDLGSDL